MSVYDKSIKNVAEAAAKIMDEALAGNQHKIDANKNNKIDAQDFKMLRANKKPADMKKEEVEQIDELKKSTVASYAKKATTDAVRKTQDADAEAEYGSSSKSYELERKAEKRVAGVHKAIGRLAKEEVESLKEMEDMIDALILEYESKGGVYKHKGTYGTAKGAEYGETDYAKENDMAKAADKPAKKKYGARQNYVRSTRVNESFTGLLEKYTEGGVKSLLESLYVIQEEPDNEQFTKELEDAKAKSEGKKKNDEIAKGAVQAVKNEEVEQVEERMMTEPEMKEREKIVKGMKKGMAGFKERYGDRAKSVMYATATKQAMKEESESEHYKAGHEHAYDHAQDSGFKVTARARKKEMLADNPHKKGTPEHTDWHKGALAGHQAALDNM